MSEGHTERLEAALAGRYRVERKLGEGGMATVYLARDKRHNRNVALKVLRPELAAVVGAERFLAEIETTANLTHPNILPLHDSGEAGGEEGGPGFVYFVMPYVEDETLRERLDREKQLPVDEAVRIATEVAEALDHAHRQGVIHRDIKPANILLREGRPLVADFGIALAASRSGGAERLTETGMSLGTPYYMSPEQATGDREVDPRTDVYALGCVLYEMLTGEPPYRGSTAQAVLGQIIAGQVVPAIQKRPAVPRHVDAALRKALEKLPADRFRSAGEFAKALADPSFRHSEGPDLGAAGVGVWRAAATAATGLAAVLAVVLAASWTGRSSSASDSFRMSLVLPESARMQFVSEGSIGVGFTALDVTPDGRLVVYTGADGETTRLYLRSLDDYAVQALPGTEGAHGPAFSQDGETIGFLADRQLKLVSAAGGSASVVMEVGDVSGSVTWSDDGRIALSVRDGTELLVIDPQSGLERSFRMLGSDPFWLPESEWILTGCQGICVVSSQTGEVRYLNRDGRPRPTRDDSTLMGWNPRFVGDDLLLFAGAGENVLRAVRFDPETQEVLSPPVEVARDIRREWFSNALQFAVSPSGVMVFVPGGDANVSELVWVDGEGREEPLGVEPRNYGAFALAPDGSRLVIAATPPAGVPDIWLLDLIRGTERRWIVDRPPISAWSWSPDGAGFYATVGGESTQLLHVDAQSLRGGRSLWEGGELAFVESVTPDGRLVVNWLEPRFLSVLSEGELREASSAEAPRWIDQPGAQIFASVSPDGDWLTYTSAVEGYYGIWALRYPIEGPPIRLSTEGGELPTWSPRNDGLYYRNGLRWYWVARQDSESEPFALPQLFATGNYVNVPGPEHAVSPEGDRLLVLRSLGEASTTTLNVVTGWLEEVERTVGG